MIRFSLGVGKNLDLVLEDNANHGARWLMPELVYGGEHPLRIDADGADAIPLTVEQPNDDPVIRLDKNGLVHPLRPGKAVIVGDIEGVKDRVNITVYAKQQDAPRNYREFHPEPKQ